MPLKCSTGRQLEDSNGRQLEGSTGRQLEGSKVAVMAVNIEKLSGK